MNASYMLCYFIRGMLGSLCSTYLYNHYGWFTIILTGITLSLIGIFIWAIYSFKNSILT